LVGREAAVFSSLLDILLRFPQPDVGGVFFLVSWTAISTGLVIRVLYGAAHAPLPLHANRLLYWAGTLALVLVGQWLFALRETVLSATGAALQLIGAGGLLYGVLSYHLFDVRGLARRTLGYFLSTVLTATVIGAGILAARELTQRWFAGRVVFAVAGLALLLAALYQLARRRVDRFINRFIIDREYEPAIIVEKYARAIGNILDLDALSTVALGTISEVLEIRRGALMSVVEEDEEVVVQPIGGIGPLPDAAMSFSREDPVFSHFLSRRQPLLQYSVDVLPAFHSLSPEQRQWLGDLNMDVYVPIAAEGLPVGLLAVGPKGSGEPYGADELQLLQTLAGQTVVALTNARLFDDLKTLNAEIQLLNRNLQQLDQVKTDFITIASHELRTPLTQVKGYAEILNAELEENTLTLEEGRTLTSQISRASDQLDEVISAMLDVSQIDVDGMSLKLGETNLERVLRIAIEPLAEALRERKLAFTVRGIRDLPRVRADPERLAQAVSNVIYNAVKYTPDGGRITISAEVLRDDQGVDQEIELVVADTGVGIDHSDHELIFDKFFRAADPELHSTGSTKFMGGGPGLGLAITRGIVESHGGRIWVESEGHDPVRCPGSRFHIVLPVMAVQPAGRDTAVNRQTSAA
jgi:signal transduction histidine kinase